MNNCAVCNKEPIKTRNLCKSCYRKQWELENLEHMRAYRRNYYHTKDDKNRIRENQKIKRKTESGRLYLRIKQKERESIDPIFKLKRRLRKRLWNLCKNNHMSCSLSKSLGCTDSEFRKHIESLFLPNMTWDNYGKQTDSLTPKWEVDHIIPLALALTEEKLKELSHYTNLRPLWFKDNNDKSKQDKLLLKTDSIVEYKY
jgi:hypothetical protein